MALPSGWLGQADNFLGIDEPWCHPDQAGVYVLPAPYEHTSSYILGSDRGPSAIIQASQQVELYDETLHHEPYREWGGVATAATLTLGGRVDGQAVHAIQDFVQPHVGRGKFVVTLTGEHTGALGAIRAHAGEEREQVFKMGGKIVRTLNITQSAVGRPHRWTCVIALAVFIPTENIPKSLRNKA